MKKETKYSPYCKLCNSCGEDGCCSHLNCFRALIKSPKCKYGETYLADANFVKKIYDIACDIFAKLEQKEISSDEAVVEFNNGFDEAYDATYEKLTN